MTSKVTDDSASPGAGWEGSSPALWALAFGAAMAAIAYLEYRGILGGWRSIPLVALSALLLVPMVKAARNKGAACGITSSALDRYNRRMLTWSLAYVLFLGVAITVKNNIDPQGPLLWLIATLPSLPIIYFIWALARYVIEEQDEYLRQRHINAALSGLCVVLFVGTAWGFFETFGVAPHVDAWWVIPVWAAGMGMGQGLLAMLDKKGGEE